MGITIDGKKLARDLLFGQTTSYLTHGGFGSGNTAFIEDQTALQYELLPSGGATARNAFTTQYSRTAIQHVYSFQLTDDQLNTSSLFEIGMFDRATNGSMFCRQTFYKIYKTSGLALEHDWFINVERI